MSDRLAAWVAVRDRGVGSQVWVERQLARFRRVDVTVVTWQVHDGPIEPGVPMHVLDHPVDLDVGADRWVNRLRRLSGRNFYGTAHDERDELRTLLHRDRPHVALCHFGHTALRLLPVADEIGVPVVAHFHGFDLSSSLQNRWYRWSLLGHIDRFAAVVVVGRRQQQWVEQHMPASRVHRIPCGVPITEFTRAEPPADGPVRFTTVSRLVPQKGVDVAVRALAAMQRRDTELVIVGDGAQLAELRELADRLAIDDRVTFTGALPPDGVRRTLQDSHVFVQHSLDMPNGWFEGFGVSLTEAAAMELPAIVSRCGGLEDQVVDGVTGMLVDQHDVIGMAAAMDRLAVDPELRRRMGTSGRRSAEQMFDTADQVRQLEEVLVDVAA